MRKIVIGGIAVVMGSAMAFGPWASAGGNGAQTSPVGPASGSPTSSCNETTSAGNGWAHLNAPGQPGNARFINGEVHLVNAPPNTTYMLMLGQAGSGSCPTAAGALTTNGNGIGNGHIYVSPGTVGNYFVALFTGGNEAYASGDMLIN